MYHVYADAEEGGSPAPTFNKTLILWAHGPYALVQLPPTADYYLQLNKRNKILFFLAFRGIL